MEEEEGSLPKLLTALGMGARAVQSLPLDDEFHFQSSFPEFSDLAAETREHLMDALALVDPSLRGRDPSDPYLWETCADICDALLEQAEAHTQSTAALQDMSQQARVQAQGSYGRMIQGLVEMDKPQQTYVIQVQNDRLQPFVPKMHPDKPYSVTGPLDLSLVEGHGLESRFGEFRKPVIPANVVAPLQHTPHVYREEINSFSYCDWQLKAPKAKPPPIPIADKLEATWIDTKNTLSDLAKRLETVDMVAIDLEAHSFRSFSGMVCLMQISIKNNDTVEDYLIDTLKLWNSINTYLASMFANPSIVKVMHGADSDVQWLQRDFGIYVVNLMDTGQAARALQFPSAGLAYLLQHYVKATADKTHQLSDWRQRPLPDAMKTYATMDTHYLLDIVPHLMYDLYQHKDTSIEKVLDASRQVCLIRYDKEPFNPDGYRRIINARRGKSKKTKSELSALQERVLASLYDWRDQTARDCDESLHFVCSDQALLRLSMACPTTVTALQSLMNPMPPMLLRFSQEVLDLIKDCFEAEETDDVFVESKNESAFFKPAETEDQDTRGILSPVLGTEEMYRQAGWLTPQVEKEEVTEIVTTTTDDDDFEEGKKPRKLLVVDTANKEYRSKQYTTHSLELGNQGGSEKGRGHTADGLGPARATKGQRGDTPGLDDEARLAHLNAMRIRNGMSQDADLLGLISPTNELEAGTSGEQDDEPDKENDEDIEEDFQIPKTMREIYKISNRNRRNKNVPSPPNAGRSGMMAEPMAVDTLEGAEAVLAASGHYASIKRLRTKSEESGDMEEAAHPSREDNIVFMKEIGWIDSKEELEAFFPSPGKDDGEEGPETEAAGEDSVDRETPTDGESKSSSKGSGAIGGKAASPFDYSSIGPIGVYNPNAPAPSNPFFAGAAVAPAPASQNSPRRQSNDKKKVGGRGSRFGRGRQGERPEKNDGRSHVYKKR